MTRLINILFPDSAGNRRFDISLLSFRLLFGLLFMIHGLSKINDFGQMALTFPDPLGVGSEISLILAIFGEVVCSAMLMLGLLTRLSLLPMMFTMCIAFFVIHAGAPFSAKELSFIYLATFMIIWISGAGKYSLDYMIRGKLITSLNQNKNELDTAVSCRIVRGKPRLLSGENQGNNRD